MARIRKRWTSSSAEYFAVVITGPKGGVSVRRLTVDWQTWVLWAALLAGMGLELLTPGTPLSAFLLIPVVASAALGRPTLTASLTVVSLAFAIPAGQWLGYDVGEMVRRSLLILVAGIVACAVAATLARTTHTRAAALARARDSEALLRAVSDAMLDPQILLQPVREGSGHITDFIYGDVNRAACEHLGVGREDLIGQSLVQTFPNIEQSGLLAQYVRCAQTGEPVALDDFLLFNGILGTTLRYDIRGSRTPEGRLSMTYRDVTDRFEVQQRLADSEKKYRLLAENSADIVCHIRDDQLVWVSPSIEAALGAPPEFWLGREVFAHAPPEDLAEQAALMAKVSGGEAIKHRVRVIGVDGVAHWLDLRAQPFYDTDGNQDGVTAALRLIDDEVRAEQRLDWLARFDALTGLVNRAETLGRLESALNCARTPGTELGVLYCDIDRFKTINDTMGHNVGDTVMRTVADRISQCLRHGDTVGRTGGDEILVLLPGLHSLDEAIVIAEKIRAHAAEPIHDNGSTFRATLSVGVTLAISGESVTDLTARADAAMYLAKHAGGNTVSSI